MFQIHWTFRPSRPKPPRRRLCYTEWVDFKARDYVNSLRISIVQYLNTAPLVRGFTHGPQRGKYQFSFTVPSQCAEALRSGEVDIAIIPAIELQRIDGLVILPNLSISSKKSVRSLLLVSKKPIHEVRRIALDRSSRSTQALVRILCAKRWHIAPEFFEAEPDLPSMLEQADAALVIGDPALRLASCHEHVPAELAGFGLRPSPLFIYDMVEKWRDVYELPGSLGGVGRAASRGYAGSGAGFSGVTRVWHAASRRNQRGSLTRTESSGGKTSALSQRKYRLHSGRGKSARVAALFLLGGGAGFDSGIKGNRVRGRIGCGR